MVIYLYSASPAMLLLLSLSREYLLHRVLCNGPGCSRSRRVTGSYGRSTGIEDLVDTSREHGRSAVSMETMDSYGLTCKGGLGPYARRARHSHEEDQAQMVTTQGLERQEPKDLSPVKGEGAVYRTLAGRS